MEHKSVQIVLRDPKNEPKSIEEWFAGFKGNKICGFTDEVGEGEWAQQVSDHVRKQSTEKSDFADLFKEIMLQKTTCEVESLRVSSKFTEFVMKQLVEHVEHLIDQDEMRSCIKISAKIEQILDADLTKFTQKIPTGKNIDTQMLEFAYTPSVQANSHFDLQIGAQGKGKLSADTVILSIGGKYQDMCTSVSRTLLVGPNDAQKKAYLFILEVFEILQRELKPGLSISQIVKAVLNKVKDQPFVKFLPKNFGYGIGMTIKEELLCLKAENQRKVLVGMVFNLRVSLVDFQEKKDLPACQNCVFISDTLLVLEQGPEVLTRSISRQYQDISYFLDEEQNEEPTKDTQKDQPKQQKVEVKMPVNNVILEGRTREVNKKQQQNSESKEQARQRHQEELFNTLYDELKQRWENDKVKLGNQLGKTFDLTGVSAYKNQTQIKGFEKKLYFDRQAQSLVCPIKTPNKTVVQYLPIHIRMIKNCSLQAEKNAQLLRVNFHNPTQMAKDIILPKDDTLMFIKELTFKAGEGGKNLILVHTDLKQALKDIKQQESIQQVKSNPDAKEEDTHLAHQALTLSRQPVTLKDLIMRPAIQGKKTIGELQTHCNGFRFLTQKGVKIDIPFLNINHAFFQPCEEVDIIVLIHFRLKAPILLGQKRCLDLQMYTEVMNQYEDINDMKNQRRRMTDADEMAQEKREIEQRKRLDEKFRKFCSQAEDFAAKYKETELIFDIPFGELTFTGCHSKSSVNMCPTATSLVSLQEPPFFATSMKDIELVHFERVSLAVKNFDFVLVYKDYANFKRISSVPMENLPMIKDWLDDSDILFTEGPISLNWQTVLGQIRSDLGGFLSQGGWSFLMQNAQESDSQQSMGSDSNFDENASKESGSESDFSGSDSDAEENASQESSDVHTGSEDTEGVDWDEMEKQTLQKEKEQLVQNLKQGQQIKRTQPQNPAPQQRSNQVKQLQSKKPQPQRQQQQQQQQSFGSKFAQRRK